MRASFFSQNQILQKKSVNQYNKKGTKDKKSNMRLNIISASFVTASLFPLVSFSFTVQSFSSHRQQQQQRQFDYTNTVLSSSNDYLGNLLSENGAMEKDDRVREMGRELQQRLTDLARMEKKLEQRMSDVSRNEMNLDARVGNLSRDGPNRQMRMQQGPMMGRRESNMPMQPPPMHDPVRNGERMHGIDEIWATSPITTIQGGSLRTWSFANPAVQRVHVLLKTDGRPLDADVELWQGPDNTPHKIKVYVEDGGLRTFSTFIDTPRSPNTVCVKNTGHLEFPIYGCVGIDTGAGDDCFASIQRSPGEIIQGGALRTYAFDPIVDSVAVMIKTDGRPLNARVELLQGPNNNKQVLALYTEDGLLRPFIAIVQTPGNGNVVRVVNTAPVEFPMHATVVEHEINTRSVYETDGIQIGQQW